MIKSREEKVKENWFKYFKNIKKENEIIRTLIEYCDEIKPRIEAITSQQNKNVDETNSKERRNLKNSRINNKINQPKITKDIKDCDLRSEFFSKKNEMRGYFDKYDGKRMPKALEQINNTYERFLTILKNQQRDNLKPKTTYNKFNTIYLENFKGFTERKNKEENTIKIRPITLIYGPNSYGKSSILQSLLLLNQTTKEGEDYKNITLRPNGSLVKLGTFNDFLNKNSNEKKLKIELVLPANHYFNANEPIQETSILTELSFCFNFMLEKEQIILPQIDIFAKYFDYTNPDNIKEIPKECLCKLKLNTQSELYEIEDFNDRYLSKNNQKNDLKKISFFRLEDFLEEQPFKQIEEPFKQIEETIKNILYISSYRIPPERYYVPENNRSAYVGKNGQYTAEILNYDNELLADVNKWLKELTGYKLSEKGKNNTVSSVNLDDSKTSVKNINLIDLGSGIAQVLPIVTQAFKSKEDMILIEEPEIHLHPKAQATLGAMFADAIQKTDNTFIIETHSENLLLRLEKLIRKGELAKDDVSIIYVDKDEEGSRCIPLILDDEGNIENIDQVPGGFFDEGFNELFLE